MKMFSIFLGLSMFMILSISAKEFCVFPKFKAQEVIRTLNEKGWKIKEIEPLDFDKDGYVKIIYE